MRRGRIAVVAAVVFMAACSDAATRAANTIESGVKDLGSAEGARADVSYAPSCSGSYKLRIEKGTATDLGNGNFRINANSGGLSVRCDGGEGSGTTYHLRFVDVPATVEVTKNQGESASIEIRRVSGRATLTGLR
jgi:hypothetical protein